MDELDDLLNDLATAPPPAPTAMPMAMNLPPRIAPRLPPAIPSTNRRVEPVSHHSSPSPTQRMDTNGTSRSLKSPMSARSGLSEIDSLISDLSMPNSKPLPNAPRDGNPPLPTLRAMGNATPKSRASPTTRSNASPAPSDPGFILDELIQALPPSIAIPPPLAQQRASHQSREMHESPTLLQSPTMPDSPEPEESLNHGYSTETIQDALDVVDENTRERVITCTTCYERIEDDQYVRAMGHYYHPEHFNCSACKKQLTAESYFERMGKPWCDKCLNNEVLLPRCAFCHDTIRGKCINALNKHWHQDHFFCSHCGKTFPPGTGFLEHDGKAYCEEDFFAMFAPKCSACEEAITTESVEAIGKSYHVECFLCAEPSCRIMLAHAGTYYDYNGKSYCEQHYHATRGSLCSNCQKPITGQCISAIGKRYHPEHFVCTFCKRQLGLGNGSSTSVTFKEREQKPYCLGCHIKLFG